MFDIGQAVLVITDRGATFQGHVKARAKGDDGGPPAYLIEPIIGGQPEQWHRSNEVFAPEPTRAEDLDSIETYLKR